MLSGFAVGVPSLNDDGLCGMAVTLVAKNYNKALSVGVTADDTRFTVTCGIKYSDDVSVRDFVVSDNKQYTISVDMTDGSSKITRSKVVAAFVTSSTFTILSEFKFSEFGIMGSVTGSYSLNVSVYGTYSDVSEQVGTGHYSHS